MHRTWPDGAQTACMMPSFHSQLTGIAEELLCFQTNNCLTLCPPPCIVNTPSSSPAAAAAAAAANSSLPDIRGSVQRAVFSATQWVITTTLTRGRIGESRDRVVMVYDWISKLFFRLTQTVASLGEWHATASVKRRKRSMNPTNRFSLICSNWPLGEFVLPTCESTTSWKHSKMQPEGVNCHVRRSITKQANRIQIIGCNHKCVENFNVTSMQIRNKHAVCCTIFWRKEWTEKSKRI